MNNKENLIKYELYIFLSFLFLNLLPVFLFKFLPTLDGPSHLHNANLIFQLTFSDSGFLSNFYQFTNELLPNWSGHFLLSFCNSFLPAWIAEKILITSYLIFLPVSFRWFIKSIVAWGYM